MKDKYLYCWGCKTSHIMSPKKDAVWKSIYYKCPKCGYSNLKSIQSNGNVGTDARTPQH